MDRAKQTELLMGPATGLVGLFFTAMSFLIGLYNQRFILPETKFWLEISIYFTSGGAILSSIVAAISFCYLSSPGRRCLVIDVCWALSLIAATAVPILLVCTLVA